MIWLVVSSVSCLFRKPCGRRERERERERESESERERERGREGGREGQAEGESVELAISID